MTPGGPEAMECSEEKRCTHAVSDQVGTRCDGAEGAGPVHVVGTECGDVVFVTTEQEGPLIESAHHFVVPVGPVPGHPAVELRPILGPGLEGQSGIRG